MLIIVLFLLIFVVLIFVRKVFRLLKLQVSNLHVLLQIVQLLLECIIFDLALIDLKPLAGRRCMRLSILASRFVDKVFSLDAEVGGRETGHHPLHIFLSCREIGQAALVYAENGQVVLQLLGIPVFQNIYYLFTPIILILFKGDAYFSERNL
jgi:hypothetical protein